ncbi:MAG: copper homeostasis periplasmic binding protein CopC [Steroidobacteraceae bacterium]
MPAIRWTLVGVIATASLLLGSTAFAHAHLVKSAPAANAHVATPRTITLTFNEELAPAFSKLQIAMADGMKLNIGYSLSDDKLSLIATPSAALGPGGYTVTWQAASTADGHMMEGRFSFTVM